LSLKKLRTAAGLVGVASGGGSRLHCIPGPHIRRWEGQWTPSALYHNYEFMSCITGNEDSNSEVKKEHYLMLIL